MPVTKGPLHAALAGAAWLNRQLEERLGAPYRMLITVGLLLDMTNNAHRLVTTGWATAGVLRLVLEMALLLDAASTLHERMHMHAEHRAARRGS